MRKLASKFASALLIPTALLLASASPALALQVVEGSDGVSVDAVLSIKEATRIRVDGALESPDELAARLPGVVFCAAVDDRGYLPTHNSKYSKPQTHDPVFNAANCRNRRIFDDRVGLAAGRNTAGPLVQTYRRDMGGGTFVLMKDVSVPIFVDGRHWGGFRLGYRLP